MAGKKIKGRKRHILVDTLGHVLHAYIHPADWTDSEGGAALLHQALPALPRLRHLWADSAYQECRDWLRWRTAAQINLEIVTNPAPDSFVVAPRRWVVERTFAWLGRWRRFTKDFEHLPSATTFLIYFVSARRLLAHLVFS